MSGGVATLSTSVKASKTWVLPPRAKPGRKSKKVTELPAGPEDDNDDPELYKATSRTKQKASRERKQEYIAELETKLRAYEQGDGERASFFQNLAKKHSAENDALRTENEELKRRIAALEAAGSPDPSSTTLATLPSLVRKPSSDLPSRSKRQRTRSTSVSSSSSSHATAIFLPASANIDPVATSSHVHPPLLRRPTISNNESLSPASSYLPPSPPVSSSFSSEPAPSAYTAYLHSNTDGCGFCETTESSTCLCEDVGLSTKRTVSRSAVPGAIRDVALRSIDVLCKSCGSTSPHLCIYQDANEAEDRRFSIASVSSEKASCGLCTDDGDCLCEDLGLGRPQTSTDMKIDVEASSMPLSLGRLPASSRAVSDSSSDTKAVPLKLKRRSSTSTSNKGKIWRIDNLLPEGKQAVPKPANTAAAAAGVALRRKLIKVGSRLPCTGDPKTCPACADDPVGQAFCSALSNTVCQSGTPCANCPNRPSPLAKEVSARSGTPAEEQQTRIALRRKDSSARDEIPSAMIPCSDAWATLREHPNIGYANLDMLASVVAKRTTCLGQSRDAEGKIITVQREGLEEALELLDHVKEQGDGHSATPN